MMAYIFPIANKKLIYLMNILQTNVLSMIMAVSYQIKILKTNVVISQVSVRKYQIIDIINSLRVMMEYLFPC